MVRGGIPSALLGLALAFGLAVAGCGKTQDNKGNDPPTGGPPGPSGPGPGGPGGPPGSSPEEVLAKLPGGAEHAVGKKLYAENGCARCHRLGETGPGGGGPGGPPGKGGPGRPGMGGPDLSKVGTAADHTADWLAAHIRDPKSHHQRSSMPPTGPDKINDADLGKLAAYLASLK